MDEISCFNNIYSDMFSLEFDNMFSTIDFESFESKENETLTEINNTRQAQRASDLPGQKQQRVSCILLLTQLIGNRTSCRTIQE